MKRILSLTLAFSAAACSYLPNLSPHRIEIQQGNFVSQEMVGQLKTGMTKDQVRFAMGTPLVADLFHGDRWDYVFVRQRANSREVERRRISVFFEQDKLVRIEGDVVGAGAATATPAMPAAVGVGKP
jgi:outer membrane protein assembly factor BamE